jgi:cyclopropane-fatty-acyl-phospholipid synthase
MTSNKHDKQLKAAKTFIEKLGRHLQINASVRLWDGSLTPLGPNPGPLAITLTSPGVIASILRWPTLDRMIRHYAHGHIDLEGGTLIDLGEQLSDGAAGKRLKQLDKSEIFQALLPFVFVAPQKPERSRDYAGDEIGAGREQAENKDFIQFHYDVGNDFYQLFLDPNMQYSCGYFTDWDGSLEQAQIDKLDMICRKLRLREGDRFLDIGCGWGGLLCHAAEKYGARAHGITLSEAQLALVKKRIASRGLEGRVTVEICDYADLRGEFDKIASIGMYEHIGLDNIPKYMAAVRGVLAEDGLFLNHAISSRAKKRKRRLFMRPEKRAILKYIFPGGELDDIGHTVQAMEQAGFEVHDVEAWRRHYALTTKIWCDRLTARRAEAVALAGDQLYRIWVAYLAGVSLSFSRGTLRIYQTLASKSAKGQSPLPPTRADLYR